jgi:hypothetical protein
MPEIPSFEYSLIATAEALATGSSAIHELAGIIGRYRNGHRRLNIIKDDPQLAEMLAGEIEFTKQAETDLRAFVAERRAASSV